MKVNLGLLTASALLLLAPVAAADPPAGTTDNCLFGGYNPDALTNVCLGDGPSTPDHIGTVGTTPGPCIIGSLCVPVPTYDPNGGTSIPSETVPLPAYVDVNAMGLYGCEAPGQENSRVWAVQCGGDFGADSDCRAVRENDVGGCSVSSNVIGIGPFSASFGVSVVELRLCINLIVNDCESLP
jgi:hypothetical protein